MQAIQKVIDDGTMLFNGGQVKTTVFLGGDLPYLQRFLGLSPSWMTPSIYTEANFDYNTGVYLDGDNRRSALSDALRLGNLPIIKGAKGVVGPPLLFLPRDRVMMCVLHMVMAFGKLTAAWICGIFAESSAAQRSIVNAILRVHQTGVDLEKAVNTPDGEETKRLFECFEEHLQFCMPPGVSPKAVLAILSLQNVLQRLYRTSQVGDDNLASNCRKVARSVRRHCFPTSCSCYLYMLEHCVPDLLPRIHPFVLAM